MTWSCFFFQSVEPDKFLCNGPWKGYASLKYTTKSSYLYDFGNLQYNLPVSLSICMSVCKLLPFCNPVQRNEDMMFTRDIYWPNDSHKIAHLSVLLCIQNVIITKTCLSKYTENLTTKKGKFSDEKYWYFSYFCSKHRLWVLVRTASARRF